MPELIKIIINLNFPLWVILPEQFTKYFVEKSHSIKEFEMHVLVRLQISFSFWAVWIIGRTGPKTSNKQTKFLNLLILEHLKNYFIQALNKFLMCFEINGLKNLKLTILRFFAQFPQLYILLYSNKNIFIVKTSGIYIIFILMF